MDSATVVGSNVAAPKRGKACVNCVQIKCKCIPCAGRDGCARCLRLKKTCVPSPAPATSKRAKAAARTRRLGSHTQRLEAKLNDLVDLLRTTQSIETGASGSVQIRPSPSPTAPQVLGKTPQTTATVTASATAADDSDLSPAEAEEIFRLFQDEMLPLEPIVYLAPDTTAQQLHRDAPFLWLCIMAVAATSNRQRSRLGAQARQQLLDQVVAAGERSLPILYGIIVLLAWFHVLPAVDRQFAVMLSQLAVAVAWDMGLTMPVPLDQRAPGHGCGSGLTAPPGRSAVPPKHERTMEERRAVLAVFSVTMGVPLMPDGLFWSPYLEDCLAHVQQAQQAQQTTPQTSHDATLIRHIRLRLLSSQMRRETAWSNAAVTSTALPYSSTSWHSNLAPAAPASLPFIFMESAQLYLDSIVSEPSSLDNFATHNLYHYARLTIHESALIRPPPPGATLDFRRLAVYERCLDSVRQTFDKLFGCPSDRYLRLPNGSVCLTLYVAVCLHRLSTLRDRSWSVEAVRDSIDLITTVDRVISIFQSCQLQMIPTSSTTHDTNGGTAPNGSSPSLASADTVVAAFAMRKFQALRAVWLSDYPPRHSPSSSATITTTTTTTHTATETPSVSALPLFPSMPLPLTAVDDFDCYQWLPDLAIGVSWM
ncbi:c6 zinc finger domain containing protein [Grosmannia clavigera kw1407]|uniref:C6 zinc finger domain containing protein n=1 Tax=Grosmannia clavigera (strain kw1407 / UAMH 11150) TaxID=655863 RepID=F0XQV5_GROCL|nr:c6 zinc finger domain containing protein [Grosmannia clavigera kw1407]EFW99761.1 c6 zinc finger domain containing protein [Grosmannia clavigera kw1407]